MTRSMNVDIDTIQDAWEISGFHGGFSGTPGWIKKRIVNILNMLVGLQFLGLSHLQFLGYYHSLDVFDQLQTGIIKVGAQGLPS